MEPLGVKPNTKVSIKHLHGDRISVKDYLGNVKEPRWHRVVRSGLYLVIECGGGEREWPQQVPWMDCWEQEDGEQ